MISKIYNDNNYEAMVSRIKLIECEVDVRSNLRGREVKKGCLTSQ